MLPKIGGFFLTGVFMRTILVVCVAEIGIAFMRNLETTMSKAMESLIRRLEDTLKRQEEAVTRTRDQLEAAKSLLPPSQIGGGKR